MVICCIFDITYGLIALYLSVIRIRRTAEMLYCHQETNVNVHWVTQIYSFKQWANDFVIVTIVR